MKAQKGARMFKKIFLISVLYISATSALPNGYSIELFAQDMAPYIPFIAEQRINAYRAYPYLYEGKMDEEVTYLEWFCKLKHSAVAIAFYNDEPVGFITATALSAFDEHFKASAEVFKSAGLSPDAFYYFSDAIVLQEHRNKSLITEMAKMLEEHADILGYTASCFVYESHESHPLKPLNYQELNNLFKKNGYSKTDLEISYQWSTRQVDGSNKIQYHPLNYWIKDLTATEAAA